MFFADRYYGYDDAVYAGARLLEIISKTRRSVSEMLADVPKMYATPEIRVDCADSVKFSVVKKIQDLFKRDHQTVTVDGLRVVFEDGWGLIRASNTQPVLVLRFEARTPERLAEIQTLIEGKLAEVRGRT
jgi:phosphomannomutase/phosphoglucomutase